MFQQTPHGLLGVVPDPFATQRNEAGQALAQPQRGSSGGLVGGAQKRPLHRITDQIDLLLRNAVSAEVVQRRPRRDHHPLRLGFGPERAGVEGFGGEGQHPGLQAVVLLRPRQRDHQPTVVDHD